METGSAPDNGNAPVDEVQELFQNTPWLFALVSALGHELRTPISGVVGLNELLLLSELNDQQKEFLVATRAATNSLIATLNDMVDIARIDSNKLQVQYTPMDVEYVLKDCVRNLASTAKERNVEFAIEDAAKMPQEVRIDGNRIKQTLLILLNSYMYVAKGKSVKLSCTQTTNDEKKDSLSFQIHLPNIEDHDLAKQFEPFLKSNDNVPEKYIPTWLRLRLANRVIKFMSGDILPATQTAEEFVINFTIPLR